jgi:hypothetical protein
MDEQDVLQHLLEVESRALSLVTDAQAEADRRVTEAENRNRALYEEKYGAETVALDEHYEKELALVKQDYALQLEEYCQSLEAMPVDKTAFCQLMDTCLADRHEDGLTEHHPGGV